MSILILFPFVYLGIVLILALTYFIIWFLYGNDKPAKLIKPEYSLPNGISPGLARYIYLNKFDQKILTVNYFAAAQQDAINIEPLEDHFIVTKSKNYDDKIQKLPEDIQTQLELSFSPEPSFVNTLYQKTYPKLAQAETTFFSTLDNKKMFRVKTEMEQMYIERFTKMYIKHNISLLQKIKRISYFSLFFIVLAAIYFSGQSNLRPDIADEFGFYAMITIFLASLVNRILIHQIERNPHSVWTGKAAINIFSVISIIFTFISGIAVLADPINSYPWMLISVAFMHAFLIYHGEKNISIRTEVGKKLWEKILGFKMYADTALKNIVRSHRQTNLEKIEQFDSLYPYALAVDLFSDWETKFTATLTELTKDFKFNVSLFDNFDRDLTNSVKITIMIGNREKTYEQEIKKGN